VAGWTPPFKDGKHAPLPGTAGFCYADNQLCGGEDVTGTALVCRCCLSAGAAPPSPALPPAAPEAGGEAAPAVPLPPVLADPAWPGRPPEVLVG